MRREHWSGKLAFILAASGSAIGLGNLWKFPYITYDNGGGLFILVYLTCIVLIGFPMMISEIGLGKLSERNPVGAFAKFAGAHSSYRYVGALGVISAFLILSYYSVVAGWSLEYCLKALVGEFRAIPYEVKKELLEREATQVQLRKQALKEFLGRQLTDEERQRLMLDARLISEGSYPAQEIANLFQRLNKEQLISHLEKNKRALYWENYFFAKMKEQKDYLSWENKLLLPLYSTQLFENFLGNKIRVIFWHLVFMALTFLIIIRGIKGGIERSVRVFMPLLFLLVLILMVNSLMLDKEQEAVRFMLSGEPKKLKPNSILEALGHAFFTLSLGMGAMMTYGSYMSKSSDVIRDAIWVVVMDTLIALMACLMIFPIIFVYGMSPSQGIGILFTTLPLELQKFPLGGFLTLLFYLLVFIAALTSSISLMEVPVSYLVDEWKYSRAKATSLVFFSAFLLGIPSALSVDQFLTWADRIASNLFLPLGGFFITLFIGYRVQPELLKAEFTAFHYPLWLFYFYKFSMRYLTPFLMLLVAGHLVYALFY
ncbi:MAG: sodium-dependent transporter [Leptospiraceae bacterium]|nr:sodium-dependent transporter [Leptospiraceae bacterium]MDW8307423.1 sodium-dependent transporter [Leptospiraceae bacterium]